MKICYNMAMLRQLREKKSIRKILWVFISIIILAFVLSGATGLREGTKFAGVVFGKKVSFIKYTDSYEAVRNLAVLTHGADFHKMKDSLNLEQAAWDRLIMVKEAKRNRIKVRDEEVIARIASMPLFQTKDGFFNERNYAMILSNVLRTTPRKFEEEIRQSLIIERLFAKVFGNIPEPSEFEIEDALKTTPDLEVEDQEKKESPEKKRERVKIDLLVKKRIEVYQFWRQDLYKRANLISNIDVKNKSEEAQPEKEAVAEEPTEKLPEEKITE